MNRALLSSVKQSWRTPPEVLDLVRQMGPIGLDPATSADNPTGATWIFTPGTRSGLSDEVCWRGSGLVFCNPEYGRALASWTSKAAYEFTECDYQNDDELIMLIPARPDTRWWQRDIVTSDAICFYKGRITFVGAPHPAPFPSALPYWGPRAERFREVFGEKGWIVTP